MSSQLPGSNLPGWLRGTIIAAFAVFLGGNILADIFVTGYEGQAESLILAGLLGSALAVDKISRRDGDGN